MKNRDYKQFGPGQYYHIYNRGNAKNEIFLDSEDFSFFIMRLQQNLFPLEKGSVRMRVLPADSFSLISYCLMPNHFHLLLRQNADIPITKLLLKICTSYSIYFNKKYERVGHVFQDQYKQVAVDDNRYLIWLAAYMHQNPKVAGLIKNSSDNEWSSYREFLSGRQQLCEQSLILEQFKSLNDFKNFTEESAAIIKDNKAIEDLLLDS